MSILPSDEAVKNYVGSWAEWMDSIGVSWEDAELEYYDYTDCPIFNEEDETQPECDTCLDNQCPYFPISPSSKKTEEAKES